MRTLDEFFNGKVPKITREDAIESLYQFGHINKQERAELYSLDKEQSKDKSIGKENFHISKLKNKKLTLKK